MNALQMKNMINKAAAEAIKDVGSFNRGTRGSLISDPEMDTLHVEMWEGIKQRGERRKNPPKHFQVAFEALDKFLEDIRGK